MKLLVAATLAALCALVPHSARAVAITASTSELVTVRSCIVLTTRCDVISPMRLQSAYGGFPGAFASSATTSLAGYGSASGSVALSGTVGAPLLRASAVSEPGQRVSTNSLALQRYTYTGTTPTVRVFGGTLTYQQETTGPHGPGVGDGVSASILLFMLDAATIEAGDSPESNYDALFGVAGLPDFRFVDSDYFADGSSTLDGRHELAASVALNPGDSVWVSVLLQTPAANGARIDASNTLVTGWDLSTDLVPAAVAAVPEPATAALLVLALPGLLLQRRRSAFARRLPWEGLVTRGRLRRRAAA